MATVVADPGRPEPSRYRLTLDVEGASLLELEHKVVDIAGHVHNLARDARPIAEIDSHVRSLGASLTALPAGAPRTPEAIAADICANADGYHNGTVSYALFHDAQGRLWSEAAAACIATKVLEIVAPSSSKAARDRRNGKAGA